MISAASNPSTHGATTLGFFGLASGSAFAAGLAAAVFFFAGAVFLFVVLFF